MTGNIDFTADNIDWDITLDSSQNDWNIGTVEETEDGGVGLGPYEIVNTSELLQNSSANDGVGSDQTLLKKEEGLTPEGLTPDMLEISWDISAENPQVDVIEEADLLSAVPEPHTSVPDAFTEAQEITHRSQLMETVQK